MSKYKSLNADSLSYEELMKNLEYNYSVDASEVVAEIDKKIFEKAYKLAKDKEGSYEITLLKGDVPNKNGVTFSPEALANAVENYNKTHKNSRLFLQPDGNLGMSVTSWGRIAEDGTIIEEKTLLD